MPRVAVPVTTITRAGVAAPTEVNADVANGHFVAGNDGRIALELRNVGATTVRNVTAVFARTIDGVTPSPVGRVMPVAVSSTRWYGGFPVADYGETLNLDVDHADLRLRAWRITDI